MYIVTPADTYSLLQWCNDQELKSHINAVKHKDYTKALEYLGEERAYRKMIKKIQSGCVNQRPHVILDRVV